MPQKKSAKVTDMTIGNPFQLILFFSLPLIAGNALQQLYNMADSIVVGRFVSQTALAAVGVAFPITFLISSLFTGLATGATVMVSQYYGAKDIHKLRKVIDTIYTSLFIGALPLTLLATLFINPILSILNVPSDAWNEAYIYLIIIIGGMTGSLGYNLNAGILQGVGDSKSPLLFLAIASILNIGLDLLFVIVFSMGVAGVAIATIIAQFVSWIFGIFFINQKHPEIKIHLFRFRFDKEIFIKIIKLGLPASIQQAMFSVSVIFTTRLVNQFGSSFAAGYNAANKLDTFAFLPIQSISIAAMTFTGQNIGAGKLPRVYEGVKASLKLSIAFSFIGFLLIPAGPILMQMFSDDAAVIASGVAFLNRVMPFYSLLAVLFILNNVMRGAGEVVLPMVSTVTATWLGRIPTAYLFAYLWGAESLNFSYAAGWVIGLAISVPYFLSGRWKNKSVTKHNTVQNKKRTF